MNECDLRPHLCTYRLNGPVGSPEDGEINEMTLPSKRRIGNTSPGGLRPIDLAFFLKPDEPAIFDF